MRIGNKYNVLMICTIVISVVCLVAAYRFYSKALGTTESDTKEDNVNTVNVEGIDMYESFEITGTIKSLIEDAYIVNTELHTLSKEFEKGNKVEEGEYVAVNKSNKNEGIKVKNAGTVMDVITNEDGNIKITVKNIEKLKVCFYIPQEYSDYYQIKDEIDVCYNGKTYICKITYISNEFTTSSEIENNEDDIDKKDEKWLYVEADAKDITNAKINGNISINEKILAAENTKAVNKSAIRYENDTPFISVLKKGAKEKVYVKLGMAYEEMVEIISDEVVVGDKVLLE